LWGREIRGTEVINHEVFLQAYVTAYLYIVKLFFLSPHLTPPHHFLLSNCLIGFQEAEEQAKLQYVTPEEIEEATASISQASAEKSVEKRTLKRSA
jgi:hypothetical protein